MSRTGDCDWFYDAKAVCPFNTLTVRVQVDINTDYTDGDYRYLNVVAIDETWTINRQDFNAGTNPDDNHFAVVRQCCDCSLAFCSPGSNPSYLNFWNKTGIAYHQSGSIVCTPPRDADCTCGVDGTFGIQLAITTSQSGTLLAEIARTYAATPSCTCVFTGYFSDTVIDALAVTNCTLSEAVNEFSVVVIAPPPSGVTITINSWTYRQTTTLTIA